MFSEKINPGKIHLLIVFCNPAWSAWFLPYSAVWSLLSRCSHRCWAVVLSEPHQMIPSTCYLEDGILSSLLWWSRELGAWLLGPSGGFHMEVLTFLFVESSLSPVLVIPFWTGLRTVRWNTGVFFCSPPCKFSELVVPMKAWYLCLSAFIEEGKRATDWLE